MPEIVIGPDCGSGLYGCKFHWPPFFNRKEYTLKIIEDIKFLRDRTGCRIASAKKAMELCKNKEIAFEFIRLKGQAVARYKKIDGRKIPWDNIDYYMEAKKRVERGNKS